jgi:L-lactate dehydrogenase complex protein LldG
MQSSFEAFKARAEGVSAEVHRCATKPEALAFIFAFLQKEGVGPGGNASAVWADCPFLRGMDKTALARQVPGLIFEVTRQAAADAKIGISQMDWAMASTGTLVQDAAAVEKRLVSTLPIIHVALVATREIVPDLAASLARTNPRQSAYISMITGPSRTADIERVLTIGVHGPERLIIVFVDELAPAGGVN